MKNDYISRKWLLDEYDKRHKGPPGGARAMIEQAPAADVRPVVFCKDCENAKHWYSDKRLCYLWSESGVDVFEDGFCSYGKRRDADMAPEGQEARSMLEKYYEVAGRKQCGNCYHWHWSGKVADFPVCRILARTGWCFIDDRACEEYVPKLDKRKEADK